MKTKHCDFEEKESQKSIKWSSEKSDTVVCNMQLWGQYKINRRNTHSMRIEYVIDKILEQRDFPLYYIKVLGGLVLSTERVVDSTAREDL